MSEKTATAQDNTEAEGVKPEDIYEETGEEAEETSETKEGTEEETSETKEGTEEESEEETKTEDEKEEKSEGEEEDVPEKYELKLPENSLLTEDDIERIASQARELGLTNEDAQLKLEIEDEAVGRYHDNLIQEFEDQKKGWIKAGESDKEIGGEAYKANVEGAKRVAQEFGSKEFNKMMDETGYGNHPEVIRVFSKIYKQFMAEDSTVISKERTGEKPIEDIFYPDQNK